MSRYISPKDILNQFRTFGLSVTAEDPASRQPVTLAYDNVHAMLAVDVENLTLEDQIVSNVYAEIGRFEAACDWEAARSESRYRTWKAKMAEECAQHIPEKTTAAGKRAAKQGPTQAEIEAYYRNHPDYEEHALAGERWNAIAKLVRNLMWSFKMKSEHMLAQGQRVGGFEATSRNEDKLGREGDRLEDYRAMADEVARIAAQGGAFEAAQKTLSGTDPEQPENQGAKKSPRAL